MSSLVSNFSRYGELSERDAAFLKRCEQNPIRYPAGAEIFKQGSHTDRLYVLSAGCCFVKYEQPDGSRQVLDVFHRGDLMGIRSVCFQHAIIGIQALTNVLVCAFHKDELTAMFSGHPRLAAILLLLGTRREALLIQRVVNLGRRSAFARLCHFVTEMKHALEYIGEPEITEFDMELPTALLADILGLSEMHTYRMLKRMRDKQLATFEQGLFKLHDAAGLKKAAEFRDDYLQLDTSWLPKT